MREKLAKLDGLATRAPKGSAHADELGMEDSDQRLGEGAYREGWRLVQSNANGNIYFKEPGETNPKRSTIGEMRERRRALLVHGCRWRARRDGGGGVRAAAGGGIPHVRSGEPRQPRLVRRRRAPPCLLRITQSAGRGGMV